jgi:hypothetical protein
MTVGKTKDGSEFPANLYAQSAPTISLHGAEAGSERRRSSYEIDDGRAV